MIRGGRSVRFALAFSLQLVVEFLASVPEADTKSATPFFEPCHRSPNASAMHPHNCPQFAPKNALWALGAKLETSIFSGDSSVSDMKSKLGN